MLELPCGDGEALVVGSAILILYRSALRIYSIAIAEAYRHKGLAGRLARKILEYAIESGYEKLTLEADCAQVALVNWYQSLGFEVVEQLPDYYADGEPAYRMACSLTSREEEMERILLVVDELAKHQSPVPGARFCAARDYLAQSRFSKMGRLHVLNLCKSYKPHSMGYYVSLLAAARNHRVTPSVMSVKDLSSLPIAQSLFEEISDFAGQRLRAPAASVPLDVTVILGKTPHAAHAVLAKKLFSLFEVPFFSVTLEYRETWRVRRISIHSFSHMRQLHPELLTAALAAYCKRKRHYRARLKNYKYDLAILVDREEKTPPSCPQALAKFRKAAEKIGFFVEFISRLDHRRLCEFDALFIRETTAIEGHTYNMARHAYTEGLVVIDDPWSILLCSNKVYLQERLGNTGILQPRGWLLTKRSCTPGVCASLPFPLVLKLPESSFSQGVFLVHDQDELRGKLEEIFARSAIVIAQEFLQSDYDWRIGLMDNTPIFACKYYMANGHWQIYNWATQEGSEFSGASEAIPINQVPSHVLRAATRAGSLIGNGLYGVDIKEISGKAYVIEVNDNPNIDVGVEDLLLGDQLYERIMQSIYNRIEAERTQSRSLS